MSNKGVDPENVTGSPGEARKATILIVEDSAVQAELLCNDLEEAGYKVIAASDGAEGLAMARSNHPVAVVSDINMPVMDGYALCKAIRGDAALKNTPVILLTMLSDPQDVIRGLEAGADAYFTKPYNVPALSARIKSLLAHPLASPPPVERRKVEIRLAGETYLVQAHAPRILNLLISTYENAVLQNHELTAVQDALKHLNQHLEQKVEEKTAAIAASEIRYRRLFEAARDGILLLDSRSGQIIDVNPFMIELLGYTREQYMGKKLWDIGPFKDTVAAKAAFAKLQQQKYVRYENLPLQTTDGKNIDVEFVSNVYRINGGEVIQCNIRDITERKRMEDALVNSERNLKAVFDAAADGIVVAETGTRRFAVVNASFCRMLGYSRDELLDLGMPDIHPAEALPHVMRQFELQANGGIGIAQDIPVMRKDGSIFSADINSTPVAWGGKTCLLGIFRDTTERKRAEQELKRVNWALRALSQGNSALVHAGNEPELFQASCEAIVSGTSYPLAWIGVAKDDPEHSIEIAASAGEAIGYMAGLEASWGDGHLARGPSETAIRTGTTQVNNDFASNPEFSPWLEQARANGVVSSVSLPIRAGSEMAGVLNVYGRTPNAFGEDEVALFEQLAGDIGYGISSRRMQLAYEEGILQRQRDAEKLHATFESAIAALAATVEQRDPYTAGHQRRVAVLAAAIGRELGLDEQRIEGLRIAGIIHDIGKISVPAEILSRPGKLSAAEFAIIKGHPQDGYEIVKGVDFPWPVAQMIQQHHERLDGSGYPQGLKGEQIIIEARILAVADVLEAMSSHRPYRPGFGIDAALAQLHQDAGTRLDPDAVAACERLFLEKNFKLSG